MRKILLLLLLFLSLPSSAFVEVREGQLYCDGRTWRPIGVNIHASTLEKRAFEVAAQYGWNSLRIMPENVSQLKQCVKWATQKGLKLCVVVTPEFPILELKNFSKKKEIWSWEVNSCTQAALVRKHCPNHLIICEVEERRGGIEKLVDSAIMCESVDILSVSLLPLERGWVSSTNLYLGLRNCYMKSAELLKHISRRMSLVEKPLIVSACAYPRDKMFRLPESVTSLRDSYFQFVLNYTFPDTGQHLGGVYFQRWELPPVGNADKHLTPMSIYPTDTITQRILGLDKKCIE
jgi:hypothetical protein